MKPMVVKTLNGVAVPEGEVIQFLPNGNVVTPKRPIIPFLEGDGIGPEIWRPARKIIDAAVKLAYNDERMIAWLQQFAGDQALALFGTRMPEDTLKALEIFRVSAKGPFATPPGDDRSLNVFLRQRFNADQCVRPVLWYPGVPSPVLRPADLDIVIFRQNTEGGYGGTEAAPGSEQANRMIALAREFGWAIPDGSGIGLNFASEDASKNLVRKAIQFAIEHGRKVVTIVAKSNNLKHTDGAFLRWGIQVARDEFGDIIVHGDDLWSVHNGKLPEGKIWLNSTITDNMFAQLLLNPTKYSVIATTNLNGDYLSDAAAAIVGGLGIAAGANIGLLFALFEATHGTAPDIAGQNKANPSSLLLSLVMMLEYIGWTEAAELVVNALKRTFAQKKMTGDMAKFVKGSKMLGTDAFGEAIVANLGKPQLAPRKRRKAAA